MMLMAKEKIILQNSPQFYLERDVKEALIKRRFRAIKYYFESFIKMFEIHNEA
jgi:hypothetical protein